MDHENVEGCCRLPGIGTEAPCFDALSSVGTIRFPRYFAGGWVILFNQIQQFTPSSVDDLLRVRTVNEEYRKNNCKLACLLKDDFKRYHDKLEPLTVLAREKGVTDLQSQFVYIDDSRHEICRPYGICKPSGIPPDDIHSFFVIDTHGIIRTIIMCHPDTMETVFEDLLRVVIALRKSDDLASAGKELHVYNRVALSV